MINCWMPDVAPGATPIYFGNPRQTFLLIIRGALTMQRDDLTLGWLIGKPEASEFVPE